MPSGDRRPDNFTSATLARVAVTLSLISTIAYFLSSEGVRNYFRWTVTVLLKLARFSTR